MRSDTFALPFPLTVHPRCVEMPPEELFDILLPSGEPSGATQPREPQAGLPLAVRPGPAPCSRCQ